MLYTLVTNTVHNIPLTGNGRESMETSEYFQRKNNKNSIFKYFPKNTVSIIRYNSMGYFTLLHHYYNNNNLVILY